MKKLLVCIAMLLPSFGMAEYNAGYSGEISEVLVYSYGDQILIALNNQPTAHPTCNPRYFSIDASVTADRRKAMLARIMYAYSTKEVVTIGYDKNATCSGGYMWVYRVG